MSKELQGNFALLAASEGGVAKLRELILSLAVRGKLVPQDPKDEPASELLKRISAEKERLIAEGKIKREKVLPAIGEDEKPFELPSGWEWVRLGSLLSKIGAGSTPLGGKDIYTSNGTKFLRSQNVWNDGLRLADVAFIPPNIHASMAGTTVLSKDILFNITGASIGRCALVPDDFDEANVSQHVTIIRPVNAEIRRHLHLALISSHVQQTVMDVQVGVSREGLSIAKLSQFLIPLAPLPEQSRIVAKVESLMALCDRLEAQQDDAARVQARWTQAALDQLAESGDADEFARNWQALDEHFDTLFATPASIDALDATLLQLAVRGKLVPQNPADEPASELLKRVRAEKDRLIAEGKIKRDKPLPPIADDEQPFELPERWVWTQLGNLAIAGPTNGFSPKPTSEITPHRCLSLSATTQGYFKSDCYKYVDISEETAQQYYLKNGDLLIQRGNSIEYVGIAAIYDNRDDQFIFPDLMMRVRPSTSIDARYLHSWLVSSFGRRYFMAKASGTQGTMPKVNQGVVASTPVPLPPFPEQSRIVAKLDKLLALTRALRTRLTDARAVQARLASALVEEVAA